jgi:hypothetical protein
MSKREQFYVGELTIAGTSPATEGKATILKQYREYVTASLNPGALTTGVPVNVAAGGSTLADITTSDKVIAVIKPAADAAVLYQVYGTVSAAGAVQVQFVGNTGVTPTNGPYRLIVLRS